MLYSEEEKGGARLDWELGNPGCERRGVSPGVLDMSAGGRDCEAGGRDSCWRQWGKAVDLFGNPSHFKWLHNRARLPVKYKRR